MREPKIGEQWILDDGSPWPPTSGPVTIQDIKLGWVRFCYPYSPASDIRMEIRFFLENFKPYVSDVIPVSDTLNPTLTC